MKKFRNELSSHRRPSRDLERDERFVDRRFHLGGVEFKNEHDQVPLRRRSERPDERHAQGYDDYYREVDSWDDELDWHSERFGSDLSRYGDRRVSGSSHPEQSFRGRGPKGYRRSDESIHEEVCHLLWEDQAVDASDIEVTVAGGIVYLKGEVDSRREKRRAESLIEDLSGVEDVQNQLRARKTVTGWIPGVNTISEEEKEKGMDAIKGLRL
jgi:translation elongation factor EF-1beta